MLLFFFTQYMIIDTMCFFVDIYSLSITPMVLIIQNFQCNESVTYTTHGGFEFLDNLEPLLQR